MRYLSLATALVFAALAGAYLSTLAVPPFVDGDQRLKGDGDIARGRLVFLAADCSSCHASPGQSDRLRLGGGMALASAFGTFRPPNISQDPADGIGAWRISDFANALVGGISPAGEHYYPAFPYTSYTAMTVNDIVDLFAYMRTLPAVSGKAPRHDLSAPLRIRRLVGFWKLAFFNERHQPGIVDGNPLHDRGAYLVEAVAHCAECHSSRNIAGAIKPSTRFAGSIDPEGTGFVPNISSVGLSSWSQEEVTAFLSSGVTPGGYRVGSSMADVIENTQKLPLVDRRAIASYIKALPARQTPKP